MAGSLRTYLSAVIDSSTSLSINLKNNSNNPTICQIALNNSSLLINSTPNNNFGTPVAQQFLFGPYIGNGQLSLNTGSDGTSSISASSYNAYSDYRLKKNIKDLDETYTVDNIRPIEYTIVGSSDTKHFGVIAHELAEIYPHLVNDEKDCIEKMQTVNYVGLIPILINEIQILKKRVENIKSHL